MRKDIYSDFNKENDINIDIYVPVSNYINLDNVQIIFYTVKKIHFSRVEEVMEWGSKHQYLEETDEGNTFFQDEVYAYKYVNELNLQNIKQYEDYLYNKERVE